jgi:hypothetical protein
LGGALGDDDAGGGTDGSSLLASLPQAARTIARETRAGTRHVRVWVVGLIGS